MSDHNHDHDDKPLDPPEILDFEIWWKNPDQLNSHYERITGSTINGPMLVLNREDKVYMVNLQEVVVVMTTVSAPQDAL